MKRLEDISNLWTPEIQGQFDTFVGIDLAPTEQLETGIAIMSRERTLVRLEKVYRDSEILGVMRNLIGLENTLVVIDLPKNLHPGNKFRQEQLKFHASLLDQPGSTNTDRFSPRARTLFATLKEMKATPYLTLMNWTKLNYKVSIPFRSRTSQGCKALQIALAYQVFIKGLPSNTLSVSVLEASLCAYTGWSLWKSDKNVSFYLDEDHFPILIGEKIVTPTPRRRTRRLSRIQSYRPSKTTTST